MADSEAGNEYKGKMISLAQKPSRLMPMAKDSEPKVTYPSLYVTGLEKTSPLLKMKVGETWTCPATFKIVGIRKDSVDLEVQKLGPC